MSNNKVTNVADPTANGDAVNYKTMNAMKTDLESQIENLSGLLDTANQKIQDLEQRVEELENNPPQPADPATKFNQIDLRNYVGGLSGSTVNTASDFKAALQYILDNNSGKHFYYGTDHKGTTWYFASDTELSALSNDSYTCGNGVNNNGTVVQETFKMHKYVEPGPDIDQGFPPNGYEKSTNKITYVEMTPFGTYPKRNPGTFEKNCKSLPEPNSNEYMFYWDNITYDVPLVNDGVENISSEYNVLAAISASDTPGGGTADYVAIKVHDIAQDYDFWTEDVSGQIQY